MKDFIMAVICPLCGETIRKDGVVMDFTQPDRGTPVVTLNLFECEEFVCDKCGTVVFTGDVDQMCEVELGEIQYDSDEDAGESEE